MIVDAIVISIVSILLYAFHAALGIYPGDAGDLVTAAYTGGIPHPPGYPLYTFFGWLVTRLPIFTPAWRMAWVSIIPHVAAIVLVYFITYRLTKHRATAIFSASILLGNYLFFLYSVTPEVFALLDFFVAAIVFTAIRLHEKLTVGRAIWLFFVLGLSLTHHPMIVLMIPPLAILLYPNAVARLVRKPKLVAASVIAFGVGLLPYLYIPVAAFGSSIINWDRPTTLKRFFELITRADYGSFKSGSVVGHAMIERLLNVKAYLIFILIDFSWVGIVLACLGFLWLWKKSRRIFWSFLAAIVLFGPGFAFYASFPTVNRFVLATVERFALPTYVLLAPLIGIGAYYTGTLGAEKLAFIFRSAKKRAQLSALFFVVLFLLPITYAGITLWRFAGFAKDRSTDNYATDLLHSALPNAIVLLNRDTPVFDGQYARYALGVRPDTIVIHAARMDVTDYHEVLKKVFGANLSYPSDTLGAVTYLTAFVNANSAKHPIMSNAVMPTGPEWVWVPHGLLFVLEKKGQVQNASDVVAENDRLWQSYHDPYAGVLTRYRHLFLTSSLDEYAIAAIELGKYMLKQNQLDAAKRAFAKATYYQSDTQTTTAYMYLGVIQSLQKDCKGALASYEKATDPLIPPTQALLYFESFTYRDCVGDRKKADELYSQYLKADQKELPLEGPPQAQ